MSAPTIQANTDFTIFQSLRIGVGIALLWLAFRLIPDACRGKVTLVIGMYGFLEGLKSK